MAHLKMDQQFSEPKISIPLLIGDQPKYKPQGLSVQRDPSALALFAFQDDLVAMLRLGFIDTVLSLEGRATYDAISAAWATRVERIQASINKLDIEVALTVLAQLVTELEQVRTIPIHPIASQEHKGTKK